MVGLLTISFIVTDMHIGCFRYSRNAELKVLLLSLCVLWSSHSFVLFYRRFGTKCAGCLQGISPSDLVRKARSKVFHLNCFTCMVCNKQLSTGEELYVIDENKFVCKEDYLTSGAIKEVNLNSGNRHYNTIRRVMRVFACYSVTKSNRKSHICDNVVCLLWLTCR